MAKPKVAANVPIKVELESGKKYAWCTCGESTKQPWCDGSHKGSEFSPKVFQCEESKTVHMCQCKATGREYGYCDGSHKTL